MQLSTKITKIVQKGIFNSSVILAATMSTKTVRDFGYDFNAEGQLRKIDPETDQAGDGLFDFNVFEDLASNQRRYDKLGEAVTEYVYDLLEKNGLHKIYVPDNIPQEKATFVFANKKDLSGSKKLMVLIHGSGVVRAGQWARSLIINYSIDQGSQLPYIKKALEDGYDILVTNTNDNRRTVDGLEQKIPGSESPADHGATVLEKIVMAANPEAVCIVAHSYGGIVTLHLVNKFPQFFKDKVFAIGFTDSVHAISSVKDDAREHLREIARNWVTSSQPLDEREESSDRDIPCYSAGHTKHEWTSYACMSALFAYFESKYLEFTSRSTAKEQKVDL